MLLISNLVILLHSCRNSTHGIKIIYTSSIIYLLILLVSCNAVTLFMKMCLEHAGSSFDKLRNSIMEVVTENICKEVIFLLSSAFYSGETLGADIFVSWLCLCRFHCFVGSPCPEVNCVYALYFSFLTHQVFFPS